MDWQRWTIDSTIIPSGITVEYRRERPDRLVRATCRNTALIQAARKITANQFGATTGKRATPALNGYAGWYESSCSSCEE
jgi:hypothetical protein